MVYRSLNKDYFKTKSFFQVHSTAEFLLQIKKAALTYEMTEQMASLAGKIPDRFKTKPEEPPALGSVRKSALKYKRKL